jgi:hypothetical protein
LSLVDVFYNQRIIEKRFLGIWRVMIIWMVSVVVINVYISMMLRLRLEFLSFKFVIYEVILVFLVWWLIGSGKLILKSFLKRHNWIEIWSLKVVFLDWYVYWTVHSIVEYVRLISNVKWVLLINWWVVVCVIVVY